MIDASVLLAILLNESDAEQWISAINDLSDPFSTPPAIAEVGLRLANLFETSDAAIEAEIAAVLSKLRIKIRELPAESWPFAVSAISRYGRGRHAARLNFGDCLAYAAARHFRAPLLYKGEDFLLTDVNDAY